MLVSSSTLERVYFDSIANRHRFTNANSQLGVMGTNESFWLGSAVQVFYSRSPTYIMCARPCSQHYIPINLTTYSMRCDKLVVEAKRQSRNWSEEHLADRCNTYAIFRQ